jgi:hypothetical protein
MIRRFHLVPLLASLLALGAPSAAQDPSESIVVIRAGRVVTVSGEMLEDAEIVIIDGKIELVGRDLEYPAAARIIDARDQTVMPGMILPRSRYGLRNYSRGGVKANLKAADEVLVDELDWEPFLEAGYTAVCFAPTGAGISGQSSLLRTAGPEDQRVLDDAVHIRVPFDAPGRDKPALRNALKKAQAEIDKVEKARADWEKKQEEAKKKAEEEQKKQEQQKKKEGEKKEGGGEPAKENEKEEEKAPEFKPPPIDPGYVPLVDLIQEKEGASPMLVELTGAADLVHFEDLLSTRDDELAHALYLNQPFNSDYANVFDRLAEREGVVLVSTAMTQLPATSTRYNLAGELARSGVTVALLPARDNPGEWQAHRAKVADLVRSGMPREDAIEAVTLAPARLFGLEERLGSIEKGKDADLIFLDGDGALDPLARVQRVMILGEIVWEREGET